jgi:hypothetical protein
MKQSQRRIPLNQHSQQSIRSGLSNTTWVIASTEHSTTRIRLHSDSTFAFIVSPISLEGKIRNLLTGPHIKGTWTVLPKAPLQTTNIMAQKLKEQLHGLATTVEWAKYVLEEWETRLPTELGGWVGGSAQALGGSLSGGSLQFSSLPEVRSNVIEPHLVLSFDEYGAPLVKDIAGIDVSKLVNIVFELFRNGVYTVLDLQEDMLVLKQTDLLIQHWIKE